MSGEVSSPPLLPTEVFLAVEPVDIRQGIDGLSRRVQDSLGHSPCNGSAYAFRNKAGNRLKLLVWDGSGVWLCVRRLHQGRFVWPKGDEIVLTLCQADWQWLIAGVDWRRRAAAPPAHWQV